MPSNYQKSATVQRVTVICVTTTFLVTLFAFCQTANSQTGLKKQTETDTQKSTINRGVNTQEETSPLLSDTEALNSWQVPEEFRLQLFAAAPEISQPIAATIDYKGRMWLAENYTYSERPNIFQRDKSDRILVLEDGDSDGIADQVKVFCDDMKLLSSVEVGVGGVWALCAPNLVFIPDADGDAVADGPPQIILDGFEDNEVGHNMVNGLRWGPDGWLYGRHGIQATSFVGRPGTQQEKRLALNCCIWRYHPIAKKFEVVCQGTTNSWGHDWTTDGELFFINTVIGHLWHAVPNSHFERMYGEDLTPYTFELTKQVADHVHWDASKERWQDVQDATSPATMSAGGGHAHSGMLFCQGPLWPDSMQGDMMTVNFHGRRLNRDKLQADGSTFTAVHQPDFMETTDIWFRGIDLIHGPHNSMFILDWSDLGECHENDGIHRTSGRIYRLTNVSNSKIRFDSHRFNFARQSLSDSPFLQRTARQRLQELAFGESESHLPQMDNLQQNLRKELDNEVSQIRLRALWALNSMGAISKQDLFDLLKSDQPAMRRWAVRLLSDGIYFSMVDGRPKVDNETVDLNITTLENDVADELLKIAETENDPMVQVYLASSMRNMTSDHRWKMGKILATHGQYATDRVYPLLIWYGLEPAVVSKHDRFSEWVASCRIPKLNRFISRRLAIEHTLNTENDDNSPLDSAVGLLANIENDSKVQLLAGIADGLRGWNRLRTPKQWDEIQDSINHSEQAKRLANEISLTFGSQLSVDNLIRLANDSAQPLVVRGNALTSLGRTANTQKNQRNAIGETLLRYLPDRFLGIAAAKGLSQSGRDEWFNKMLEKYRELHTNTRPTVLTLATQKQSSAKQLLNAIESQAIPKADMTPYLLRQLQLLSDKDIETRVVNLWPERKLLQQDQLQRIVNMKEQLSETELGKANLESGHRLFIESCAKCHKLFGEGEVVGPDLTGGQRSNLTYWLQNILAPSAEVGTGFRMSIVLLNDGRTLSGVITERSTAGFKLTTQTDQIQIQNQDVEAVRESDLSLMPDGLMDSLTDDQKRDLIGYLMSNSR